MTTYQKATVYVGDVEFNFNVKIEMYDNHGMATIYLSHDDFEEFYTWYYFEETLKERIAEIVNEDYDLIKGN